MLDEYKKGKTNIVENQGKLLIKIIQPYNVGTC